MLDLCQEEAQLLPLQPTALPYVEDYALRVVDHLDIVHHRVILRRNRTYRDAPASLECARTRFRGSDRHETSPFPAPDLHSPERFPALIKANIPQPLLCSGLFFGSIVIKGKEAAEARVLGVGEYLKIFNRI